MFWNVQDFGIASTFKDTSRPLAGFIAAVVQQSQADVLFIQELKAGAISDQHLQLVQWALCRLPAPYNNWYYEFIKGSLRHSNPPYTTANELDWDAAHHEGYAMFWNQNIAKFRLQSPPQVLDANNVLVANEQSETVRGFRSIQADGQGIPLWGMAVPPGGITVRPDPAYTIPAGTLDPAGQAVPAGPANSGTVLPTGTTIGGQGVKLTGGAFEGADPVVVPGGFVLTNPLTLPAPGTAVVPQHVLSLVLEGRDTRLGGAGPSTHTGQLVGVPNFAPGFANWQPLYFTRGGGFPAMMQGARRPAFATIDVNNGAVNPGNRIVPLIAYHAPSAAPAHASGMQRASFSRPLYQAWDPAGGAWIDTARAVVGGDFNVVPGAVAYPYLAFTDAFNAGGAGCHMRVDDPPIAGATNPLNKTTVALDSAFVGGNPIVSAFTNAYRTLAIDNVFYRGFVAAAAPPPFPAAAYDLLQAVSRPATGMPAPAGAVQGNPVSQFLGIGVLRQVLLALFGGPAAPATPNILSPGAFIGDVSLGGFGGPNPWPARRAAEFLKLFVSDHLPVLFAMQL
jgi:hypothetical protein